MKRYFSILLVAMVVFIITGCTNNQSKVVNTHGAAKTILQPFVQPYDSKRIAIIFSSKNIGKYAINATNTAMSYLISQDTDFHIEVFDIEDEELETIENLFDTLNDKGISRLMVLLTHSGAQHLKHINNINSYDIYLPLIHKNDLDLDRKSIIYGSIDYSKQLKELLQNTNNKYVEFHDNSPIGDRLAKHTTKQDIKLIYQKELTNNNKEYARFFKRRHKLLQHSTLIINMPIVKSSIVLSQINANDITPARLLSTQINYSPLLLSLTQVHDRQNIRIANSIGKVSTTLEEYNALLDSDIVYNWVNYSTAIGMEYLLHKDITTFEDISLEQNQVQYPIEIYTTTKYSLKKLR